MIPMPWDNSGKVSLENAEFRNSPIPFTEFGFRLSVLPGPQIVSLEELHYLLSNCYEANREEQLCSKNAYNVKQTKYMYQSKNRTATL